MYQDQANEIDEITGRIQHLTRALKVMGIYAADEAAIERLMKEGNDAVMIPVKNWAAFIEKGGLQNAVQFVPLADVVNSLQQLYQAREACKQIIYETTGLSDIIRGASNAAETATAQQIKSQFASLRLNDMKDDMARFARDVLRMKAQIMCSKYQDETLINASGIMHTPEAQLVPQAIALLRNATMRDFNIDIETDTLVLIDQQQDKQERIEFLTAVGGYLQQAQAAAQASPEMLPLLSELLLFGVRGFKIGRTMESSLEQFVQMAKQQAGQKSGPTPEQQKMQADAQAKQAELQIEQQKAQAQLQIEQLKINNEQQVEARKIQLEQEKAQLDANTRIMIAEMQNNTEIKKQALQINASREQEGILEINELGEQQPNSALSSLIEAVNANMAQMMEAQHRQNELALEKQAMMIAQMQRPRQVMRDINGKIVGVQ
jgi:hypothetical protein